MELDRNIPWPQGSPANGVDFVVYSTDGNGVPSQKDDSVLGTRRVKGWVKSSNQAGVGKLQVPDGAGGWVTTNGAGAGDTIASATWFEINFLRPAGPHRYALNFTTAPTTLVHSDALRAFIYP